MTNEQTVEYRKLVMKAKDTGIKYGIYSKQYAKAIHMMNDYWKLHKDENEPKEREKTFKEKVIEKRNQILAKWKRRNY